MSKVYLSGPITGLTYGEARFSWREVVAEELGKDGIEVLSPMRHEGHLAEMQDPICPDNLPNHFFSHSKMLVMKDFLDIDVSDIVLVNLLGAKVVSQGTIIEMGYAYAKQKPIIVVREANGNVHNSPFVGEMGIVVESLEQATIIIRSLLSTGV